MLFHETRILNRNVHNSIGEDLAIKGSYPLPLCNRYATLPFSLNKIFTKCTHTTVLFPLFTAAYYMVCEILF